jgi:mRNA interferase RelE/StbE
MKYELFIESRAEKDLKKLEAALFKLILAEIENLSGNPHPHNSRKITGSKNDWRIRIGDYRVLYEIDNKNRTVKIMRIKHRRNAYRNN